MRHIRLFLMPNGKKMVAIKSKNKSYLFDEGGHLVSTDTIKTPMRIDTFNLGIMNLDQRILSITQVVDNKMVYWSRLHENEGSQAYGVSVVGLLKKCDQQEMSRIFQNPKGIFEAVLRFQKYHYPKWA